MAKSLFPATPSPNDVPRPWRLWLIAAVAALLFGGGNFNAVFDDPLRTARNAFDSEKASGDIVLVAIDEESLKAIGEWPWPRSLTARIVDQARTLGARRMFIDFMFDNRTIAVEDQKLRDALARFGKVTMPARTGLGSFRSVKAIDGYPLDDFAEVTSIATISATYNYQHAVLKMPYGDIVRGKLVPSYSALLANKSARNESFRIRYAINPNSIVSIKASDLLQGKVPAKLIAGKDLVLAPIADNLGDQYWIPGHGRMAGTYAMVLAAETLKRGVPQDWGWLPLLSCVLIILRVSLLPQMAKRRKWILSAVTAILLFAPFFLERHLIFVDAACSLFAMGTVTSRLAWIRWKARGLVDHNSGLPNLTALKAERETARRILVAARVQNFSEIASIVGPTEEQQLVKQIVDRLAVAKVDQQVFQGEEGIFVWLVDPTVAIGNHLEALHALFRSPVTAGGRSIDLAVSFGAELGSTRSLSNRLGSALVAADDAWSEGLRWKYHDPARQEEVQWRLSLLGELDSAIDNGEVWLAFQPQLDLQRGIIIGAEALARWTHPTKGPIGPSEFIAVAEANGRIGKLTDFVLDRAIATAASINGRGIPFIMAVNLSARLLSEPQWIERVSELLKKHKLPPECLTLELTETAALHDADGGLAMLDALRGLGVRIAIDDYGTGLSTLDYLKKVPAQEIKLDQSFIKAMRVNRGDLLMVQSTIALAHSLGRTVVAEGVEDQSSLDDLRAMGCDIAQGFAIGRPMGVRELVQRLNPRAISKVA